MTTPTILKPIKGPRRTYHLHPEQDAAIQEYAYQHRLNASIVVRQAIDLFFRINGLPVMPQPNGQSTEAGHDGRH